MSENTASLPAQSNTPITPQDAFMQNMAVMNAIVQQMKEIPVLPSEMPKDKQALEKVEFPDGGGMLTFMEGHAFPYRGFPYHEFVDKIDVIKKIVRGFLSGIYHSFKRKNKILFLTFIPTLWALPSLTSAGIYVFYRIVDRFKIKKERYSQVIRELHRAFSIDSPRESGEAKELRIMLRDLICMVLEFDNAYRFRFQDIIVELDKSRLHKHPIKELLRLVDILSKREQTQDIQDTWVLIKLWIRLYLRIDRKMRKIIVNALENLDFEKVKLTPEDIYWSRKRKDYHFKFMDSYSEFQQLSETVEKLSVQLSALKQKLEPPPTAAPSTETPVVEETKTEPPVTETPVEGAIV